MQMLNAVRAWFLRTALARWVVSAILSCAALITSASGAAAQSIDGQISDTVKVVTGPFVDFIFSAFPGTEVPWIVAWLIIAAFAFTVYFGFIQFRVIPHALRLVRGDFDNPNSPGEVSHFQALSTALSGTVGLGNIAGVAVAISIGGPGATFWMILAGLLGMATKFVECTLGVKYRNEYPDGRVSGGPMYYLSKGLAERGLGTLGRIMAIIFSIFCVMGAFGAGNMFQANQVHAQLVSVSGGADSMLNDQGWVTGAVMALIVFSVIVGGIKSIANVASTVVPFMGILYFATAILVLALNASEIGPAFVHIWEGAFTEVGVAGGFVGALIQGFKRAAFSNEAGLGSAPIAHSAVRTNEPTTEGFVSLLEPFIDTVVICTLTALVIIVSGVLQTDPATGLYVWNADAGRIATQGNVEGVALTSLAFGTVFSWFPYLLAVAVVLFAFSTMLAWSYYGLKAWTYLFGEGRITELVFNIIFCIFIVIGAAMNLAAVIDFADAAIFAMAFVNIAGLYLLAPVVKREVTSYLARLESGEIRPTDVRR